MQVRFLEDVVRRQAAQLAASLTVATPPPEALEPALRNFMQVLLTPFWAINPVLGPDLSPLTPFWAIHPQHCPFASRRM